MIWKHQVKVKGNTSREFIGGFVQSHSLSTCWVAGGTRSQSLLSNAVHLRREGVDTLRAVSGQGT